MAERDTQPKHEPVDLDALEKLAEEATPGPWGHDILEAQVFDTENDSVCDLIEPQNAEFITRCRTAVPALIAELRDAREKLDNLRREVRALVKAIRK